MSDPQAPTPNTAPPVLRCAMCGSRTRWDAPPWITCRRGHWSDRDPRRVGWLWHLRVLLGR